MGKRCNAFQKTTDIKQVLNESPTNKRHVNVPQDSLLCPIHVNNKKKTGFQKENY